MSAFHFACAAGELLAIGNVMLVSARNEKSQLSLRMPMAIDEFLRIVSIQPPPKGAPLQLEFQWVKSDDHKLQVRHEIFPYLLASLTAVLVETTIQPRFSKPQLKA